MTKICITLACPKDLIEDANHFVATLGGELGDLQTFRTTTWKTKDEIRFATASFVTARSWLTKASVPVARPEWDTNESIDLEAARRAKSKLFIWDVNDIASPPILHGKPSLS